MDELQLDGQVAFRHSRPSVTIGNFDGVHRGHQALVAATVEWARRRSGTAAVLTFDPHPSRVLTPERAPGALTTPAQKRELLAALGTDVMAVLPFTEALARVGPAEFVDAVLVRQLRASHVVVGAGFRFGHRQTGEVRTLEALGRDRGFSVEAIAPVLEGGEPISSSRVREALAAGDATAARTLLGRAYFIDAAVVKGDGRGRTIGVPTANLASENEIVPGRGVYAGRCRLPDGASRLAVVNVGARPTFGGATLTVEAHLLDFEGDLYGSRLRLAFEVRLREERRFPGPDALVAQIREDVARARALLPGPRGGGV